MLATATPEFRSKVLWFITGSARPPSSWRDHPQQPQISRLRGDGLPRGATCSYSLQLPCSYKDVDELRKKLTWAVGKTTWTILQKDGPVHLFKKQTVESQSERRGRQSRRGEKHGGRRRGEREGNRRGEGERREREETERGESRGRSREENRDRETLCNLCPVRQFRAIFNTPMARLA